MSVRKPTKKFVKIRDNSRCRKCGEAKELQIHHVLPQRLGGPDEDFNLISLCAECHCAWHRLEMELDIKYTAKRVVTIFYQWLKEEQNVKILLGNCRIWKEFKDLRNLSKSEKKQKKRKCNSSKAKKR